jgi:hypothetical protein
VRHSADKLHGPGRVAWRSICGVAAVPGCAAGGVAVYGDAAAFGEVPFLEIC